MPAYVIVDIDVKDADEYKEYIKATPARALRHKYTQTNMVVGKGTAP